MSWKDDFEPVTSERIFNWASLSEGDLRKSYRVRLKSGGLCFLKRYPEASVGQTREEAEGLLSLNEPGVIRIPKVFESRISD